jgi:excisionase family DNA binding protein
MERLTVREAARRLGVTPATIRRRIAAGELQAERETRPQGTRWLVRWDGDAQGSPQGYSRVSGTDPERDPRIAHLEAEVAWLRSLVEELTRRVPELLAGSPPPEPPPTRPPEGAETGENPPRRSRPWWKWWAR